jgi:hypothetical protein
MDRDQKAELLKQFAKAGYDIDQAEEEEVKYRFNTACSCNRSTQPSLLDFAPDEGADEEDVNAAATEDLTPDGNADELLEQTDPDVTLESAHGTGESIDDAPVAETGDVVAEGDDQADAAFQEAHAAVPETDPF